MVEMAASINKRKKKRNKVKNSKNLLRQCFHDNTRESNIARYNNKLAEICIKGTWVASKSFGAIEYVGF